MIETVETNKECVIEILTRKGVPISGEHVSAGDIKVDISGEGFCDGVIRITLSAPSHPAGEPSVPGPRLTGTITRDPAAEFSSGISSALSALRSGDEERARRERENLLDGLINDDRLIGSARGLRMAEGNSREAVLLNAMILLYSGESGAAGEELEKIDLAGDLDAIYLKARCEELEGCWNEVGRLCKVMMGMFLSARGERKAEPRFRKILYRLAILNEERFNRPGSGIMRDLALETLAEDCFTALRGILRRYPTVLRSGGDSELFRLLTDAGVSDELFLQHMRTARALDEDCWGSFIEYLKRLDLPYPWDNDRTETVHGKNVIIE